MEALRDVEDDVAVGAGLTDEEQVEEPDMTEIICSFFFFFCVFVCLKKEGATEIPPKK